MALSLIALAYFAAALIVVYLLTCPLKRISGLPLPPGPKRLPFIGNYLDVPSSCEWLTYANWGGRFGSQILHFDIFGLPIIVINSAEAAHELFDKKSWIYSDRPRMTMLNEITGYSWHFGFMPYSEEWRRRRKMFHQEFNPKASVCHRPTELIEARKLLGKLLDNKVHFIRNLRHFAGSVILGTAYGIKVQAENDPYVATAEISLQVFAEAGIVGRYLVDILTFLKYIPDWFPGANFKIKGKEWRKSVVAMVDAPFKSVMQSLADGTAVPSITSRLLEEIHDNADDKMHHEQMVSEIVASGSDTTVSALGTFVLAMLQNPAIQSEAQQQIDDVLHGERLPDFDDEEKLPYVHAIVKEVLRWKPVAPLPSHRLMEDDVYQGYHLPAGSFVYGNSWAILHDPVAYPSPHIFDPARFLTPSGTLNSAIRQPDAAFGFGRRVCPGRDMAYDSIWITVASILAVFQILPAVDSKGEKVEVSGEYTNGLVCYPKPFDCIMRPRTRDAEALIMAIDSSDV